MKKKVHIKDTFTFEEVPFDIVVYDAERYVSKKRNVVVEINGYGDPAGYRNSRDFLRCDCRIVRLRPDYPYTQPSKNCWVEYIETHIEIVEPLEKPVRKLLFLWNVEDCDVDPDPQHMASTAIGRLKDRYDGKPDELAVGV
jgi:hypothetical protein